MKVNVSEETCRGPGRVLVSTKRSVLIGFRFPGFKYNCEVSVGAMAAVGGLRVCV